MLNPGRSAASAQHPLRPPSHSFIASGYKEPTKSWTSEIREIWNGSHTYSNSYILLNFFTNETFTIQKLPRSKCVPFRIPTRVPTWPDYLVNRDDQKNEGPFREKNCTYNERSGLWVHRDTQGAILRNPRTKCKRSKNVFAVTSIALTIEPRLAAIVTVSCAVSNRESRYPQSDSEEGQNFCQVHWFFMSGS